MTDEEFDHILESIAELAHNTHLIYKYKHLTKLIRARALNGEQTERSRKILQMSDAQIAILLENGGLDDFELPE